MMNNLFARFLLAIPLGFVACGCMTPTSEISFGADDPLIRFTNRGLMFREAYVTPREAVRLMERHRIPKDATIHLLVDRDYTDTRATWVFQRNYLARAGYTKSILVHERRAEVGLARYLEKARVRPPARSGGAGTRREVR